MKMPGSNSVLSSAPIATGNIALNNSVALATPVSAHTQTSYRYQPTMEEAPGSEQQRQYHIYTLAPTSLPTWVECKRAPEPPVAWDGIFEATHRVKCPQPDGTGDENCLVINVFSPEHAISLPVLIYFHGGGFNKGWGLHNGPIRVLQQDLIFVTFNHRLGALGFLNLDSPEIPGNAGLKDQVAALYWIHKNIAKFGGNPLETTVYGTGSGAASIELLILTNLAKNLFQKAILENGSALSPSSVAYDTKSVAFDYAFQLGYNGDKNSNNLEEFYFNTLPEKLSNISRIFLPCIEKDYKHSLLDKDPWDIIEVNQYYHTTLLIIYTMAEETLIIAEDSIIYNVTPDNLDNLIPKNLEFDSETNRRTVAKFIKTFYFENNQISNSGKQNYIDFVNDVFLRFPVVQSTVFHAFYSTKPVFLMNFLYKGQSRDNKFKGLKQASYNDILRYITSDIYLDENDELMAEKLISLWSNFIKLGDPTPITTSTIPTIWQPVVSKPIDGRLEIHNVPYLKFGKNMINAELDDTKLMLWDRIYNKFHISKLDRNRTK